MKTLIVLLLSTLSCAYGFLDLEELKSSNFDIEILNNPIVFEEVCFVVKLQTPTGEY